MISNDYIYLNVPGSLETKAWVRYSEDDESVLDQAWIATHRLRLQVLVRFFHDYELLKEKKNLLEWETWVLRFGDFTEEGQRFLMVDYPGKWDAAWDRNPKMDPSDVKYLVRKLRQMRESESITASDAAVVPNR